MVENTPTLVAKPSYSFTSTRIVLVCVGGGRSGHKKSYIYQELTRLSVISIRTQKDRRTKLQLYSVFARAHIDYRYKTMTTGCQRIFPACRSTGAVRRLSDRLVVSAQLRVQLESAEKCSSLLSGELVKILHKQRGQMCKRARTHVCLCVPNSAETKPPLTLIVLPPPAPPTRCRGVMPHPLGACCSRAVCSSSLFASLWLLPAWRTERVWASFLVISKPPALIFYPPQLTANCSSQHQDPTPPTRPRPASWLCGILATANGGPIESLRRAACWLDSRIISNEDDSNDFTPSFPSPLLRPEYWYF